ncbi:MAG: glycosyltransferase family 2 protein [Nanoarchaeota archaeon]
MKTVVLIPALNEELTVAKVVKDFRRELPKADIQVWDNGSTDKTAANARKAGAKVVVFPRKGKGRVMQEMFESVDADLFVLVDADDTYEAKEVHRLIDPVAKGDADMCVGTRLEQFSKEEKRVLHGFGNRLILAALHFCFPTRIKDMLSGYRVFNREVARSVNLLSHGFTVETELTVKSLEEGFSIKEMPISYRPRPQGSKSKLHTWEDGMFILTTVLSLFRDYRPMQFFLLISIIPFAVAVGFGSVVLAEYFKIGTITKVGTLIMAVLFFIITFILWSMGFLASSIHQLKRETMSVLIKMRKR